MPTIATDEIKIHYQIRGSGFPLVLISGVGYGGWFWNKMVVELEDYFQVITFDNRGAGETDKPPGPYNVPMLAGDTISLLGKLNINRAFIVGHSLGGYIAQEIAVTQPDLVKRLVLCSTTNGGKDIIPITPEAYKILTNREGDPLELVKRGIEVACAPGFTDRHPEVVKELIDYRFTIPVPAEQYQAQVAAGIGMAAMDDRTVEEALNSIRAQTLIIFGEYDKVVPPGNADILAGKLPNARKLLIPDTGHIFPIEKPEKTAEALKEFLLIRR